MSKIKDLFSEFSATATGVLVFFAWAVLGLLGLWIERTFGAAAVYIYAALAVAFIVERVITIRKNQRAARKEPGTSAR